MDDDIKVYISCGFFLVLNYSNSKVLSYLVW